MGRKKILIKRIPEERNRQVTFTKRKNGLLKKAMELSVLCDAEIAVIIFSTAAGQTRLHDYCSSNITSTLIRMATYEGTVESRDNRTFNSSVTASTQTLSPEDPRAELPRASALAALASTRRHRDPNAQPQPQPQQHHHQQHHHHPHASHLPPPHPSHSHSVAQNIAHSQQAPPPFPTSIPISSHPSHKTEPTHIAVDDDDDPDDDDDTASRDASENNQPPPKFSASSSSTPPPHQAVSRLATMHTAAPHGPAVPIGVPHALPAMPPVNAPSHSPSGRWHPPTGTAPPPSQPPPPMSIPRALPKQPVHSAPALSSAVKQESLIRPHAHLPSPGLAPHNVTPFSSLTSTHSNGLPGPGRPILPQPLPSPRGLPSPRTGMSPRSGTVPTLPSPRDVLAATHDSFPPARATLNPPPPPTAAGETARRPRLDALQHPPATGGGGRRLAEKKAGWRRQLTVQIPDKPLALKSPPSASGRSAGSVLSGLPSGAGPALSPVAPRWTPSWGPSSATSKPAALAGGGGGGGGGGISTMSQGSAPLDTPHAGMSLAPMPTPGRSTPRAAGGTTQPVPLQGGHDALTPFLTTPHNGGDFPADPLATPKGIGFSTGLNSSGTSYPPLPSPTNAGLLPIMSRSLPMPLPTPTMGAGPIVGGGGGGMALLHSHPAGGVLLGKRGEPDGVDGNDVGPPTSRARVGQTL